MKRIQAAASPQIEGWQLTLSKPNRQQPHPARLVAPHLLNRPDQLLILEGRTPALRVLGETCDECQPSFDGPPDLNRPILPRPQIGTVPPESDPCRPKLTLQPTYPLLVLSHVGDEYMSRAITASVHFPHPQYGTDAATQQRHRQ